MEHLENKAIYWFFGICVGLAVISTTFLLVYLVFFGLVSFVLWDSTFMSIGETHGIVRLLYVFFSVFASFFSVMGTIFLFDEWLKDRHKKLDKKSESD